MVLLGKAHLSCYHRILSQALVIKYSSRTMSKRLDTYTIYSCNLCLLVSAFCCPHRHTGAVREWIRSSESMLVAQMMKVTQLQRTLTNITHISVYSVSCVRCVWTTSCRLDAVHEH